MFWITFTVYIISVGLYFLMCSGEKQWWADGYPDPVTEESLLENVDSDDNKLDSRTTSRCSSRRSSKDRNSSRPNPRNQDSRASSQYPSRRNSGDHLDELGTSPKSKNSSPLASQRLSHHPSRNRGNIDNNRDSSKSRPSSPFPSRGSSRRNSREDLDNTRSNQNDRSSSLLTPHKHSRSSSRDNNSTETGILN